MKLITKLVLMISLLSLGTLGAASLAYAQTPTRATPGGGVRGEVTAVGDSSLTISTPDNQTITVNVSAETRIRLTETRSEGNLADIAVGNFVGVRGPKNDDGSIAARLILVLPENPRNLDRVRGRVTAVDSDGLRLDTPNGEVKVLTSETTHIRIGQQPGNLSDINVDDPVLALGNKQGEGELVAQYLLVVTGQQVRQHTLRGEVIDIDPSAGTLSVQGGGQKEGVWTVQTNENTKYRIPGVDNPSLADIKVGNQVLVIGRKADGENTGIAWHIAVIPEQYKDSMVLGGEVTAVNGNSFTLNSLRGEFTVQTNADTQYRTRGDKEVSLADVTVGSKVLVAGKMVDGQPETILAKVVGLQKN